MQKTPPGCGGLGRVCALASRAMPGAGMQRGARGTPRETVPEAEKEQNVDPTVADESWKDKETCDSSTTGTPNSAVLREDSERLSYFKSVCGEDSVEDMDTVQSGSDVWLHIYQCDPYTGFLNRAFLDRSEIGIFHAGVEVYQEEWAFQYYEDTWEDPSVPGLVRCNPRRMPNYEFVESVYMGRTAMPKDEVDMLLLAMHDEWPACSYHLTHRNCLTFAEELAAKLQAPRPFPSKLKGIMDASHQNANVDAVVDYTWSWLKWWMVVKNPRQELVPRQVRQDAQHQSFVEEQVGPGLGSFYPFFSGTSSCSSVVLCPGSNTVVTEFSPSSRSDGESGEEVWRSERFGPQAMSSVADQSDPLGISQDDR
mmetsp:Transcript_131401/g.420558  ORF Transcript_131401/g.420558 Transcript_131401/m.420558 type:complete len:367 (+) Transcript_131401:61-1161(+)